MLRKFTVSNFKSFEDDITLDLTQTNNYTFNPECIRNNTVNSALIYGYNGCGKSNLGLAIFDIIEHLTDHNKNESRYSYYTNANSKSKIASFKYEFQINEFSVIYEYKKTDYKTLTYERLKINDKEAVVFDRSEGNTSFTSNLKGTEYLIRIIDNPELSVLKYIKSNTSFVDVEGAEQTFLDFFIFIEKMLYFRSLEDRMYLGFESGTRSVSGDIIEKGKVEEFERLLNEVYVGCKLSAAETVEGKILMFDFEKSKIPFDRIASTGTNSLALFFYWFQRIMENKTSLIFIDEFDAFYHHQLAAVIINKLKKSGVQFILTTHNTSIITNDLLRPDCYFLMYKKEIHSLSKRTSKELREAHNIEKMYKAGAFYGE
ncbi:MAG: AAA family ATPase [Bacteroidales bacterium]